MNNFEKSLFDKTVNKVLETGYTLVSVEDTKEFGIRIIRFTIENLNKEEPISCDDTTLVSEALSDLLDEIDPIETEYYLEVSSVGLEKELKTTEDLESAIGKFVNVKTYEKIEIHKSMYKEFEGDIVSVDDETVEIKVHIKQFRYPVKVARKLIAKIRLAIKMN